MLGLILGSYGSLLRYAIPLILGISLVYGATRHELMMPILNHAYRTAVWIVGFMAIIAAVLAFISWLV
ncbi:MAG: hypothetical protein JJ992_21810 [Planctomycetes bacterium]|nr:hypothetical protein [Planctomycetota bacterium]